MESVMDKSFIGQCHQHVYATQQQRGWGVVQASAIDFGSDGFQYSLTSQLLGVDQKGAFSLLMKQKAGRCIRYIYSLYTLVCTGNGMKKKGLNGSSDERVTIKSFSKVIDDVKGRKSKDH